MATNKIKRIGSKKSHAWWWDSHISPKNSHWLSDNLQEMDKQVKEMLTLIEEEGDSFAKKAEIYYQKRPELISHVEIFYRMYRTLAERYDNVTGELKKNIPKRFHSEDSLNGSDSSPEKNKEKRRGQAGFDFFLGSKGSSESESESESDENGNENETKSQFHERIVELEEELKETKEKVRVLEEKNLNSDELEKELLANRYEIECLKGAMEASSGKFKAELANRDFEIVRLKEEFEFASRRFLEEKSSLEAQILNIQGSSKELREEMEIIMNEKLVLESRVSELEQVICDLKASTKISDEKFSIEKSNFNSKIMELTKLNANFEAKIEQFEANASENVNQISQLNQTILTITSQLELNLSEKNSLEEKITTMDSHLNELHLEHAKLISEIETTKRENEGFKGRIKELEKEIEKLNDSICENAEGFNGRIKELEKEIEKQHDLICENAEGKREAIRQLCMSVEYYRDGYCQLRKLLHQHKRRLIFAN